MILEWLLFRNETRSEIGACSQASSGMKFIPHSLAWLSCEIKNKYGAGFANMLLSPLMATFAILTSNLTIGLLLWAKQKMLLRFFLLWVIVNYVWVRTVASVCVFMRCSFISERTSFCVYMIPEWNVIPERKFHSEMKTGMNSFRNDLTFVSVSCKQIQRDIWEWTRSRMKVNPESCPKSRLFWDKWGFLICVNCTCERYWDTSSKVLLGYSLVQLYILWRREKKWKGSFACFSFYCSENNSSTKSLGGDKIISENEINCVCYSTAQK